MTHVLGELDHYPPEVKFNGNTIMEILVLLDEHFCVAFNSPCWFLIWVYFCFRRTGYEPLLTLKVGSDLFLPLFAWHKGWAQTFLLNA